MLIREIKQAVIFAGGTGERLLPLTGDIPKPMVVVAGRPFLEHLLLLLKENGIEEAVILVSHLPEKIKDYFGDGARLGLKIKYVFSEKPGSGITGTRLKKAEPLLDELFLLLYCDNYWPLQLEKLFPFHQSQQVLATVTIYNNRDGRGEYGAENNIHAADDGLVQLYDRERKDRRLNGIDIGFFIVNKAVLDWVPAEYFSFEKDLLPKLIEKKQLAGYRTDHPYYPITNLTLLQEAERFLTPKKIIFLDRDGVINKKMPEHDYVKSWQEFQFLPGAIEGLRRLTVAGYKIFLITNQQGVGKGLMTEGDLQSIHEKMSAALTAAGVKIMAIYYCPHLESAGCYCRKPQPGLLFRAAREHYLDLTKSFFIGDSPSDLEAGRRAGCRTIMFKEFIRG